MWVGGGRCYGKLNDEGHNDTYQEVSDVASKQDPHQIASKPHQPAHHAFFADGGVLVLSFREN